MSASAKKKSTPSITIPTLTERVRAIAEELVSAPAAERHQALTVFREVVDAALSECAERLRPKGESGIPAPWIRMQLDAKGHGNCLCRSLLEISKEN
jgi:hypothetical protein